MSYKTKKPLLRFVNKIHRVLPQGGGVGAQLVAVIVLTPHCGAPVLGVAVCQLVGGLLLRLGLLGRVEAATSHDAREPDADAERGEEEQDPHGAEAPVHPGEADDGGGDHDDHGHDRPAERSLAGVISSGEPEEERQRGHDECDERDHRDGLPRATEGVLDELRLATGHGGDGQVDGEHHHPDDRRSCVERLVHDSSWSVA